MTNIQLYKKVAFFVRPYRFFFIGALVLSIVAVCAELVVPVLTRQAIDKHIGRRYYYITKKDAALFETNNLSNEVKMFSDGSLLIDYGSISELSRNNRQVIAENKDLFELFYLVSSDKYSGPLLETMIKKEGYYLVPYSNLVSLNRNAIRQLRAHDIESVVLIFMIIMGLTVAGFITAYAELLLVSYSSNHVIHDIRMALYKKVVNLPVCYFEEHKTGKIVTRISNDIENIQEFFAAVFVNIIKDIAIITGIVAVLIVIDLRLGLVTMAMLPVAAFISAIFRKKMRRSFTRVREALAVVNGRLSETLSGIAVIQIFKQQSAFLNVFNKESKNYRNASSRQVFINSVFTPMISMLRYCGMGYIIYLGSNDVARGFITLGTLVVFIAYLEKFFRPIQDIAEKIQIVQSALASADRVFTLMDQEPEYDCSQSGSCRELVAKKSEYFIEFCNVWFAYREEDWVLRDFSMKISHGEVVAIVGETGCGKSTIIKLLSRMYMIQKGAIYINGININSISKKSLRRLIGVVQQNVTLFSDTVRYNILLGREPAGGRSFEDVCNYASCTSFIEKLPYKADTMLSEEGKSLSFGERQLISFARIVAYDPAIFILDEATSNIDTETEHSIQKALNRILKEKSSIVIAHRLSTIRHSDKIVVVSNGSIIESGSHNDLMSKKGRYYRLYMIQYKEHLEEDDIKILEVK
ncbi:MAG: ABC transporter ATP-binding protein [Spirochaetes bacterium]|nr:ABC transporter ATP-binding protein [Spirochaetota bacterium]MBN2769332.1 ABC transporter ATP-binding protein [Spirochaetota bacterium]